MELCDAEETAFEFYDPGKLVDGDLELILAEKCQADPTIKHVPEYKFHMHLVGQEQEIGHINLRIGEVPDLLLYGGQIGYDVELEYRGHHYAARAAKLILPLARSHGMKTLWITCDPDNIASRKTCERVGAKLIEIVDVPEDHEEYRRRGWRQKCRYRLDL